MLRVDLRELARGGALQTRGKLAQGDPALAGLDVTLLEPVVVGGRLQSIGEGRFYWQGTLRTLVQGECRRCLQALPTPGNLEIGAPFTPDPDPVAGPDSVAVA